ncbi:type II secretion system F family protein [Nonomuraea endophytica]|uniref:Tight adherence protein B n=1 Tax=Nonomuraea endophytica TaxID=714136 RepID=A0A7W7ZXF1_9ACTN|nr:type II secretion system F family protein [Nonomuraea endophytica]MBB5075615.1 tight adherence protein B [Nonomuraea endophytica]
MNALVVAALAVGGYVWLWSGFRHAAEVRLARILGRRSAVRLRWAWMTRPVRRRRSTADEWHRASIELCHALSAELVAGRTPGEALARAIASVEVPGDLREVTAAARDGGDVAAALVAAAPEQGGEGLRRLAACWSVGVGVGGGMAALVERVALALRAAQAHRQDVAAQLAGPRATARLLAGLPVLGVGMAAAMGMRPLDFLFGGVPGLACLGAGVLLDIGGLWWTGRMARAALAS